MTKMHQSDLINWGNIWNLKNLAQIFIGAAMAVFAIKGFMIPNQFMDGGVTGISILLHEISHLNISIFIVVFNLPFIYLGYKRIGKRQRGYLPGSFSIKEDCEIIVTVVTRLEVNQIQESISAIDPKAFMYIQSVNEAAGGILKEEGHAK